MEKRPILRNKYYLYMTEFFSGLAVMAVELCASRLMAPYFSSSQVVWTIIIGIIMIAMALGNFFGGRWADRDPNPDKLYRRILIAAVWIAMIPVLGKYVILGISGALILTISTNFLVTAAFLACLVIFAFPLFLLGTVTPSLIKYTVDDLNESGRMAGTLGTFNTVGSILGTFLPTFVTIPTVGTAITFLMCAGILLAIGLIYFLSSKAVRRKTCAAATALFVFATVFGHSDSFAFWEDDLTYEGESIYNYLQVKEDDTRVTLSTNVLFGVQSVKMKSGGLTGMYYDYALAAPAMADVTEKDSPRILILGNGTGTFATQCSEYYGNASLEGVEIDEKITELAYEYFDMSDDVTVTTYDGRAYLQAVDEKYDVIMVDAYQDITIPFQMSTTEFFTLVREHLTEDGIMVVNTNMHNDAEGSINEYLCDTIASVFPYVCTVDVVGNTNREVFAGNVDPAAALAENLDTVEDQDLRDMLQTISARLKVYTGGDCILTDDRAPVELLGMRALNSIIEDELGYYRDIFRTEGIRGLLEEA